MAASPRSPRRASRTVDVPEEPRGAAVWLAAGEAKWAKATVESREDCDDGGVAFELRLVGSGDVVRVTQAAGDQSTVLPRN